MAPNRSGQTLAPGVGRGALPFIARGGLLACPRTLTAGTRITATHPPYHHWPITQVLLAHAGYTRGYTQICKVLLYCLVTLKMDITLSGFLWAE